jgi:tetratricopeptide (TPR) repeat protein
MKSIFLILSCIVCLGMLSFCTSGRKAFQQGNYYESVMQSVERLRRSPNNNRATQALQESYPMAVKYYLSQIQMAESSSHPLRNSQIVENYFVLNRIYDEIMRSPAAMQALKNPQSFHRELETYRRQAADERYSLGLQAMQIETRQGAMEAYRHFVKADEYFPNYMDVRDKIEEARYWATLKVIVEQVPVPSLQFQLSINFFQNQVDEYLYNYQENELVRFFPPTDTLVRSHADHILVIQFDDFVVGQANNFMVSRELSKDSVVIGKVRMDDGSERNVLGTVKAKLNEHKRELISTGLVSMRVIDPRTEAVILHDKFPGQFVWSVVWGNFNGDERALTPEQLAITKLGPVDPPPPQELFVQFCRPIYGQLRNRISAYYRNF